jgi:sarcosine oxidase subunit delta
MALRIPCPHCGLREHTEFVYGGELRPIGAPSADDEFARVYLRENAAGLQEERWFHLFGCRRWTTISRDTITNAIGPG